MSRQEDPFAPIKKVDKLNQQANLQQMMPQYNQIPFGGGEKPPEEANSVRTLAPVDNAQFSQEANDGLKGGRLNDYLPNITKEIGDMKQKAGIAEVANKDNVFAAKPPVPGTKPENVAQSVDGLNPNSGLNPVGGKLAPDMSPVTGMQAGGKLNKVVQDNAASLQPVQPKQLDDKNPLMPNLGIMAMENQKAGNLGLNSGQKVNPMTNGMFFPTA